MSGQSNYDVIIVGAGLAGLSCAFELCRKGKHVLVLEAHPYAGGRTSSFDDNGMVVESGLHRYIGYYSALPSLLKKCGTSINDIVTWEEKVDILIKGKNKKLVLGLAPVFGPVKTLRGIFGNRDILTARDKLSLLPFFVCGFAGCLSPARLDRYSVSEYAQKHRVTPRAQHLVLEPLSTGIFFLPPDRYSAYAFFGMFLPAIPKFYKMRIGAFVGGMEEVMCQPIVRRIKELGGSFLFGTPAERVIIEHGAVKGVVSADGKEYRAENTVIAAHLPAAKRILSAFRDTPCLSGFFRLPCMSACTVQLELSQPALKRDITTFGPGTDMISFAEQSRSTFRGSKGRLSVIFGRPEYYVDRPLEDIIPTVVSQMDSLGVHLDGIITDARKVSERNEFYSLAKGSQQFRPRQRTGIDGLILAGDYTLTPSFATMEGAVISGKKAAKECLKNKKR